MKEILTLDQRSFDPQADTTNRPHYAVRRAARAVVTDADGAVALLYAQTYDYYKLPGGGIEANEEPLDALEREIKEELGCEIGNILELGEVIEWRDFWAMKQVSYCYQATVRGAKGEPSFTDDEIAEGFRIVWVPSLIEAITYVEQAASSTDLSVKFMATRDTAILKAVSMR